MIIFALKLLFILAYTLMVSICVCRMDRYSFLTRANLHVTFVQTLQFLVRDWCCPYLYPYGAIGGQMLLEKRIQVGEDLTED